jgi:hypothetical protein
VKLDYKKEGAQKSSIPKPEVIKQKKQELGLTKKILCQNVGGLQLVVKIQKLQNRSKKGWESAGFLAKELIELQHPTEITYSA